MIIVTYNNHVIKILTYFLTGVPGDLHSCVQLFQVSDQHFFSIGMNTAKLPNGQKDVQNVQIYTQADSKTMSRHIIAQKFEKSGRKQSIFTHHAHPVICCQV